MKTSNLLRYLRLALFVLGVVGGHLAHAAGSPSYFLTIAGLTGDSRDASHKGAIDLGSFSWGVQRSVGLGGTLGKASFNDFAWTQLADSTTPPLFVNLATGRILSTVTLDVTATFGGGSPESFFQLIFTNTAATMLKMGGSTGQGIDVNAAMTSGETVKMRYRATDSKGALKNWVEGSFSIKNNTANAVFEGDPTVLTGLFASGGLINIAPGAVAAVPEPASATLLLAGLAAVGALNLRRRRG